jgi:hypothetical protein
MEDRRRQWDREHPERANARSAATKKRNPEKYKAIDKAYRQKNREQVDARIAAYRLAHPEKVKAWSKAYRNSHKEQYAFYQLQYRIAMRDRILEHYGGEIPHCECCGEKHKEFLTIDHIDGGGAEQRKDGLRGQSFYLWLIRNNFPSRFRILCMNCNFALGMKGYCPHESQGDWQ